VCCSVINYYIIVKIESAQDLDCPYYFKEGFCKFGDKCRYNHQTSQSITNKQNKQMCRHFEFGNCKKGNNCKFQHTDIQSHQSNQHVSNQPLKYIVLDSHSIIGIDIGGVIISLQNNESDTSFFGDNFLNTPMNSACCSVIRRIVDTLGQKNVFLISKAGTEIIKKTMEWMRFHNFIYNSGILESNIHFCSERSEKGPIVQKLGINIFIDDRVENLEYAKQYGAKDFILFGSDTHKHKNSDWFFIANSWQRVEILLFECKL